MMFIEVYDLLTPSTFVHCLSFADAMKMCRHHLSLAHIGNLVMDGDAKNFIFYRRQERRH